MIPWWVMIPVAFLSALAGAFYIAICKTSGTDEQTDEAIFRDLQHYADENKRRRLKKGLN